MAESQQRKANTIAIAEVYAEPCQASKVDGFAKIVNGQHFILDV